MNALLGEIAMRQGWRCFWCRYLMLRPATGNEQRSNDATIDHVVPRWLGGDKRLSNIVAACRACNSDRGGMHQAGRIDPTGFNEWFRRKLGYEPQRFVNYQGKTLTVRSLFLRFATR